ncbi:MAG: MlaD family protein [Ignavibacteriaceae bacterium]|jgi:phospholipid/cholesterol/gamma-HCH transport system substrate-binding protein
MKNQRKTEIKVGVTVILALVIFFWILGWAKNFILTTKEKTIKIRFDNVAGLEIGDFVTVNGVRKGNVQDIEVQNNEVIVTVSVNNNTDLRRDAVFGVAMLDMMGGKKVDIKPGSLPEPLDFNKIQNGSFYSDIPAVMSFVGSMQDDLITTLKQVKVSLNSLNNYLTDKNLNNNIKSSVENVSLLTEKLNILIDENRQNIKKLTSNSLDITDDAKDFYQKNQGYISSSIKEADDVLKKTDSLVTSLNSFTTEIKARNNSVGKILYDEKLYDNLNQSIQQVNELTKLLIEQLKDKGFKVDANIHLF